MKRDVVLSKSPLIVLRRGFLPKRDVAHVLAVAKARWKPTTVVDGDTGGDAVHEDRTGYLAEFRDAEDSTIYAIEDAIADWTKTRLTCGETLQGIRYGRRQEYRTHYDWFDPTMPAHAQHLAYGGQRAITAIVCLKAARGGGQTEFPKVNLRVALHPGDALYWRNVLEDGKPDPRALHAGLPVTSGEKIILSRWIRERAFDGSEETKGPVLRQRIFSEISSLLARYHAKIEPKLVTTTGPDGSINLKPVINLVLPGEGRGRQ